VVRRPAYERIEQSASSGAPARGLSASRLYALVTVRSSPVRVATTYKFNGRGRSEGDTILACRDGPEVEIRQCRRAGCAASAPSIDSPHARGRRCTLARGRGTPAM